MISLNRAWLFDRCESQRDRCSRRARRSATFSLQNTATACASACRFRHRRSPASCRGSQRQDPRSWPRVCRSYSAFAACCVLFLPHSTSASSCFKCAARLLLKRHPNARAAARDRLSCGRAFEFLPADRSRFVLRPASKLQRPPPLRCAGRRPRSRLRSRSWKSPISPVSRTCVPPHSSIE